MKHSTDRILTTHAGSLPLPPDLKEMLVAKNTGQPYDKAALAQRVKSAVADAVKKQLDCGLDIINDGELGKPNFSRYARERLSGFVERQARGDERPSTIYGRDLKEFAEYFQKRTTTMRGENVWRVFCNGPLKYIGHDAVKADIENFREALKGHKVEEAFLPAVAPGTLEHWLKNDYYKTDEEYLFALAEAMREEYKAIVDAGFLLQIDNPDLPDAWQVYPEMSVAEYRKYAEMRVDALYHGPHKYDIPLREIVDLILKVRANTYSIEAANVRHEHEWRVWEEVKLPEGKVLVPGVVAHATDIVEHPRLIADRLIRYAKIVGRENVMGGTDCGLGPRVGHANIAWAKFEAM